MKFAERLALFRNAVEETSDLDEILASNPVFRVVNPVYNKRAKRLSLRVDSKNLCIRLTIPPRSSERSINRFLNQQIDWIDQKSKTLPQKNTKIKDGDQFMFQGRDYTVRFGKHDKRITTIDLNDNGEMIVLTSRDDPSTNVKRWVIEQAKQYAEPLIHSKAAQIDKKVTKIDLWDTASRWGSCSSSGRIMLCWRLIFAPDYVFDYVIGHEVAHLKHMDHGKKFWDLCYSLCDRPDEARAWLKQNGNSLLSFF